MTIRHQIARPELGEPEWQAVRAVIESGWVTQGPKVAEFELGMAAACGAAHAVAVSSCTTALHLALVCAGVRPGDEVIVPSMSFIATANAVVHAGARPVFAEVDGASFNLDLDDAAQRITPRTSAILLVHQLGLPGDIEGFAALAHDRGIALVEDAACAVGSTYHDAPIGSHSDLVCFSFHPRKLLTTGDGGMVVTGSPDHAARMRRLRQHGMSVSDLDRHQSDDIVRERYVEVGFNYRMTDVQAAMGVAQLRRLPEIVATRQRLAAVYDAALADDDLVSTPIVPPDVSWNVQTYTLRLEGADAAARDEVMRCLLREGIASRPGVMTAHREPAYAPDGVFEPLPRSEQASDCSLAIPLHGGLSEADCEEIAAAVRRAVRSGGSKLS
ncbi:MAG: DegT/DnrJ/EryC1/StrS family aminotransferase [Microthrixaceae bacterium]